MQDDPEKLTTTEARAGETPHIARYVLMVSLVLVILIFVGMLLFWGQ